LARFYFKLQRVLDARKSNEDQALQEFGAAVRELEKQREIGNELNRQRVKIMRDMTKRRRETLPFEHYFQDSQSEDVLKKNIQTQKAVIKTAENQMVMRRDKLIKAVKERKLMEKLKYRKFKEFIKMRNQEEFKFADEVAGRKVYAEEPLLTENNQ